MNRGDGWTLRSAAAIVLGLALTAAGAAVAQTVMKHEPPPGALKRGTVVLVDDGSCPAGQIKEVTAGAGRGGIDAPRDGVWREAVKPRQGLRARSPLHYENKTSTTFSLSDWRLHERQTRLSRRTEQRSRRLGRKARAG